jgi:hypothetical protein
LPQSCVVPSAKVNSEPSHWIAVERQSPLSMSQKKSSAQCWLDWQATRQVASAHPNGVHGVLVVGTQLSPPAQV